MCANSSAYHKTNNVFPLLMFMTDHLQGCAPESDEVSAFLLSISPNVLSMFPWDLGYANPCAFQRLCVRMNSHSTIPFFEIILDFRQP